MAVPLARLLAVGLRRPGLRGLLWLIEARGLANRSEGLGWPGPVDKSEGFRWAGLAQGPSIKVRGWGAGLAQGLSIKVRGWGPGWPANRSEGFWGYGPRAGRPTLFGKPSHVNVIRILPGKKSCRQGVRPAHKFSLLWQGDFVM